MYRLRQVILICTCIVVSTGVFAQIKAVEQFLSENEGIEKFFIYQSSLRMLNQNGDENFNKLIRDVRKINVYFSEQASDESRESYNKLISALGRDDFETLVSVKHDGMLVNFLGKESGRNAYYILALTEEDSFGVMEMDGKLDLSYLSAVENVDLDKLREIVGQDKSSDNNSED